MTSSLLEVVVTTHMTPICDDLTLVVNCEFVLYCMDYVWSQLKRPAFMMEL
jgi:hypothetical protein